MARIRDLWHQARPSASAPECGEHTSKKARMVATSRHGVGLRWQAEWTTPEHTTATKAFGRKPDAEAHLASMQTDVQRGEYIDPRAGRRLVRQLAEEWLRHRLVAGPTAERDAQRVDRIVEELGDIAIGDLRTSRIRAWLHRRAGDASAGTANHELRVLHAICEAAVDDDLIRRNPVSKVDAAPESRYRPDVWPVETIAAMITGHRSETRSVPILAVGAGLRIGEALAIGREDVDWLGRRVHVRRQIVQYDGRLWFAAPKYGGSGSIPVEPGMIERLSLHVAAHEPRAVTLPWLCDDVVRGRREPEMVTVDLLTATRTGHAIWRPTWLRQWQATLRKVEIEPAGKATGVHVLRHAYATYLLYEGVPLLEVQRRLRHSTPQTLMTTYAHVLAHVEAHGPEPALAELFRLCSVPVPDSLRNKGRLA